MTAWLGRPFPQADWTYLLHTSTGWQHQPSTLTPWWWHA
jgi:hypothetical protein